MVLRNLLLRSQKAVAPRRFNGVLREEIKMAGMSAIPLYVVHAWRIILITLFNARFWQNEPTAVDCFPGGLP
jgi:hypothetical protein